MVFQRFQQGLFRFDRRDESYGKGEDSFGFGAAFLSNMVEQAQEGCWSCAEKKDGFCHNIFLNIFLNIIFGLKVEVDCSHGFCDVVLLSALFCFRVVDEALRVRRELLDGCTQHDGVAEDGDIFYGG